MNPEKHLTLANRLADMIERGSIASGEKLPTQQELCEKYEVSRSCVHNALNLLAERGLIRRVPGKGIYVSPEPAGSGEIRNVGVVMPDFQNYHYTENDNYGLDIFWGIERALRNRACGCQLLRIALNDITLLPEWIERMNLDALILDHRFTGAPWKTLCIRTGVPTVFAGHSAPCAGYGSVEPDYFTALQYLFSRIAESGKKRIDLLYPNDYKAGPQFIAAIAAGKSAWPMLDIRLVDFMNGKPHDPFDDPYIRSKVSESVKNGTLPDVFIGHTDWSAYWIHEELKLRGLERSCGVVGFLGLGIAEKEALSSFSVDAADMGKQSVDLIFEMNRSGDFSLLTKIPFRYMERESLILQIGSD